MKTRRRQLAAARRNRGSGRRCDARGFTLIEVLLATLLMVTLLAALWTLFGIYTDLFETGQAKTQSAQLARALLRQLTDDLHSAIQDPIPAASTEARTSTPLRRFVLSGTRDQLRLDVLQVTPLQGNPTPVSDSEQYVGQPPAARVPELRTVFYTFRDPLAGLEATGQDLAEEATAQSLPGLVRRELDFETPASETASLGGAASDVLGELSEVSSSAEPGTAEVVDTSVTWVPEVVRCDFRYFDGSGWTSEWNSLSRKALPVAVEVSLQMAAGPAKPATGTEAPAPSGTELALGELEYGDLDGPAAEQPTLGQPPEPQGPVYRLVVDLPGSPKHAEPKKPASETSRLVLAPRPVPRRVAPRPVPPPEPAVQPLGDEWMRTQP